MASITVAGGLTYRFDPSSITALTQHSIDGRTETHIVGLTPAALITQSEAGAFLASIGMADSFAGLTSTAGYPVWINAGAVDYVRDRIVSDPPNLNASVSARGMSFGVVEAFDAASEAIHSAGGKI